MYIYYIYTCLQKYGSYMLTIIVLNKPNIKMNLTVYTRNVCRIQWPCFPNTLQECIWTSTPSPIAFRGNVLKVGK